jgi:hypothetical protein
MKDEALKLALSCIKSSTEYKRGNATFVEAAEDVEQALAAPVQKRPQNCGTGYCSCIECVMEPAAQPAPIPENFMDALRFDVAMRDAAQPAPVQEPVAHCEAGPGHCQQCHKESLPTYGSEEIRKLREVIQSQSEIIKGHENGKTSVNFLHSGKREFSNRVSDYVVQVAPPAAQRQWVGLTTEDMATCIEEPAWDLILRKAEQILKEKNT